jgi:hypothetical protein
MAIPAAGRRGKALWWRSCGHWIEEPVEESIEEPTEEPIEHPVRARPILRIGGDP